MEDTKPYNAVIITVSDRSYNSEREDITGAVLIEVLEKNNFKVLKKVIVPDQEFEITASIQDCVKEKINLIVTNGGTGFSERDVTPEATLKVIERRADGLSEAMRLGTISKSKFAILSRGVSGIAKQSIIVNLPGSPTGAIECIEILLPILPHAIKVLTQERIDDKEHKS